MTTYQSDTSLITKFHEVLSYDGENLLWKESRGTVLANQIAGYKHPDGAIRVRVFGKLYLAHRVIFAMHYGYFPEFIDHKNGNRSDNRLQNLREATRSENNRNTSIKKSNKSGAKGVSFCKDINKWRVRCRVGSKEMSFGLFDDFELAELVAIEVRNKYHGEFARH